MRATGNKLIAVNATGCLEVFSTPYPETSWQVPWIHSLFGNAAAVATGIAAAQRALGRDDVRVIAQGGDGGTTDIGFGCLSGMFERNDDVLYICYDNEAYMNTGVQRSSATPPLARTATTPAMGPAAGQRLRHRQERAAHRDGAPHPVRRHRECREPARPRGEGDARHADPRRALHPHLRAVPAGLGLRLRGHHPHRAPRPGMRPLPALRGAPRQGHLAHADPAPGARHRVPEAPEALRAPLRQDAGRARIARIQAMADQNIADFGLLE
jgi:pyruvate ferredoxin oxidoreductase beta subunit